MDRPRLRVWLAFSGALLALAVLAPTSSPPASALEYRTAAPAQLNAPQDEDTGGARSPDSAEEMPDGALTIGASGLIVTIIGVAARLWMRRFIATKLDAVFATKAAPPPLYRPARFERLDAEAETPSLDMADIDRKIAEMAARRQAPAAPIASPAPAPVPPRASFGRRVD